tara:strand:+ start:233 stop:802 length:570 start_codon:yes stop_codon:yes gene_type:complete
MIIAGIDYSMRSPSICTFAGTERESFTYDRCKFFFLTDTKKYANFFLKNIHGSRFQDWNCDFQRYKSIADWAIDHLMGCDQIAIEGYSMGSKGKTFNIAENTGILKYKIHNLGIPLEVVPPTTIKKFATGKGNADKEKMHKSFVNEVGLDLKQQITPDKSSVSNPVSDIVDSYYICKYLYDKIITSSMD